MNSAGEENSPPRPRMTMRVYRISPGGAVTELRGPVGFTVDENLSPLMTSQYPPCRCPRHTPRGG